jgi:hypothetical protein
MPKLDVPAVEWIIADTINETARGDSDALAAPHRHRSGRGRIRILPANGMEDISPCDQSFDERCALDGGNFGESPVRYRPCFGVPNVWVAFP